MSELIDNAKKAFSVLKDEGMTSVIKHVNHYVKAKRDGRLDSDSCKDILFINGCDIQDLPHPHRYRVSNQKEQLISNGYTCDEIFYKNIDLDLVYRYRAFIIFRCIHTEKMEAFIKKAQSFNKPVFYDIDDLVFDTKYTDMIPYVKNMEVKQKEKYDVDVMKYGQLLSLCNGAITTTERLANELSHYVKNVIINRNSASLELMHLSKNASREKETGIHLGYFSGSITHNADFEMILPVIVSILKENPMVTLHLCGELDFPNELDPYTPQIKVHPFMDWKQLPELISKMDINLAPLATSIFNEAKSEIKWMEAALVKVPTIASDFGAFHQCIENGKTGILCSSMDEWESSLRQLIDDKTLRETIGNNAFNYCKDHYITLYNGMDFIEKLNQYIPKNICFVVAKIDISGGILVALRHASYLQNHGYDVSFLSLLDESKEHEHMGNTFPVLPIDKRKLNQRIDIGIATMWSTVEMMEPLTNIYKRCYLVQNYETEYYEFDNEYKVRASQTYNTKFDLHYLTISKWCQNWLRDTYRKDSIHIYNGIETKDFYSIDRDWSGKIRILIEGDSQAPLKNVDEAFKITNQLDKDKFEVWYMSYNAAPKDWYQVDKFMNKVPYKDVPDIYRQCHILVKTSVFESFSYPPLEMMTTGGCVVALANDGNVEYLTDKYNCLFYPRGDIEAGIQCVKDVVENEELRNSLIKNGLATGHSRDWKTIEQSIVDAYVK